MTILQVIIWEKNCGEIFCCFNYTNPCSNFPFLNDSFSAILFTMKPILDGSRIPRALRSSPCLSHCCQGGRKHASKANCTHMKEGVFLHQSWRWLKVAVEAVIQQRSVTWQKTVMWVLGHKPGSSWALLGFFLPPHLSHWDGGENWEKKKKRQNL